MGVTDGEKFGSVSPDSSHVVIVSARFEKNSGSVFIDENIDQEKSKHKKVPSDSSSTASSSGVSSRPSSGGRVIIPKTGPSTTQLPLDFNWQKSHSGLFRSNAVDPLPPYTDSRAGDCRRHEDRK